jgi:hypothetical protein
VSAYVPTYEEATANARDQATASRCPIGVKKASRYAKDTGEWEIFYMTRGDAEATKDPRYFALVTGDGYARPEVIWPDEPQSAPWHLLFPRRSAGGGK